MNRCIAIPEVPKLQDSKTVSVDAESARTLNLVPFPHSLASERTRDLRLERMLSQALVRSSSTPVFTSTLYDVSDLRLAGLTWSRAGRFCSRGCACPKWCNASCSSVFRSGCLPPLTVTE